MYKKIFGVLLLAGGPTIAQAQSAGLTTNQNDVAAVLATPVSTPDRDAAAIISAITIADPLVRSNALGQLSPEAYSLVPEVSLNAVEAQETNVLGYVRDLRGKGSHENCVAVGSSRPGPSRC